MEPFFRALSLVALAELGDKTQLIAIAFATRFGLVTTISGLGTGILLTNLLAAALGSAIGLSLPLTPVRILAGLAFLGFAVWTFTRPDCEGEDCPRDTRHPFLTITLGFLLAELGDKTQLTTLTLGAESGAFLPIWLGASLGMALAVGLGVAFGSLLATKSSRHVTKYGAGILFTIFGLFTLADALGFF